MNKKKKIHVDNVKIFISTTFNNTLVYLSDIFGNVLSWASAGSQGLKGSRKGTPYASRIAVKSVCKKFFDMCGDVNSSLKISAEIFLKGPSSSGESAVRELSMFFLITKISNITGLPHNGCRPKKMRRV